MEFAVKVKGNEQARWVLAVDPAFSRLLMANDDKTLEWVAMADCEFVKAHTPEHPQPVFVVRVQPQKEKLSVARLVRGNHG